MRVTMSSRSITKKTSSIVASSNKENSPPMTTLDNRDMREGKQPSQQLVTIEEQHEACVVNDDNWSTGIANVLRPYACTKLTELQSASFHTRSGEREINQTITTWLRSEATTVA